MITFLLIKEMYIWIKFHKLEKKKNNCNPQKNGRTQMKQSQNTFKGQNRFTSFIWQGNKQRRIISHGTPGLTVTTPYLVPVGRTKAPGEHEVIGML